MASRTLLSVLSVGLLLLLVLFDSVVCHGVRVRSADEADRLEDEFRRLNEGKNDQLAESIAVNLLKLILITIVLVIMAIAIYKCLKRNEEFYRNQETVTTYQIPSATLVQSQHNPNQSSYYYVEQASNQPPPYSPQAEPNGKKY